MVFYFSKKIRTIKNVKYLGLLEVVMKKMGNLDNFEVFFVGKFYYFHVDKIAHNRGKVF